jgi:pyridoxal/pyridoxine/pyridoxamine kinase
MGNQQFQSAVLEKLEQLTTRMDSMENRMGSIEANMATKDELARVKEIVVKIENEHGLKLGALFDGYVQNADKLDRIEKIVARHDEALLKKVK